MMTLSNGMQGNLDKRQKQMVRILLVSISQLALADRF